MQMLHIYTSNPVIKQMLIQQIQKHRYTDSGFDIPCLETPVLEERFTFELGVHVAATDMEKNPLPCLLLPRSSLSSTPFRLSNSIGLIDAGYRGEVKAKVDNVFQQNYVVEQGSRLFQICQHSCLPWKQFVLVDSLDDLPVAKDTRGSGGFGSTG
jgi:dUTP pyrophosphatase